MGTPIRPEPQQPTTLSGLLGQRDRERAQNPVPDTLRLAADATQSAEPTRAARVLRVQGKTAWPTDFIDRNLEVLELEVEKPDFNAERFWRESPAIAAWMAQDPTRVAAARGRDMERMGRVEGYLKAIGTELDRNRITTDLTEPALAAMFGRATPEQEAQIARLRKRQQELPDVLGTRGFVSGIPIAAIGQLPITLDLYKSAAAGAAVGAAAMAGTAAVAGQLGPQVAIPEELATVPAAALRGAYLGSRVGVVVQGIKIEAANAFLDYREMEGVDRETAAVGALIAGTMAGALELLPFENAAKAIPGLRRLGKDGIRELLMAPTTRRLLQRYAGQVLSQMGAEGVTEGLQELVQVAGGVLTQRYAEGTLGMLSTETILREIFAPENLSRIGSAARAGAQGGGGQQVVTAGASTALDFPAVRRAEVNAARMQAATEAIHGNDREEAIVMAKDAPEAVKQAVASVGSEGVYFDVAEFTGYWQSQTTPDGEAANPRDVAIALGVTPEAYDAAVESGAPLNIPTQNFLVDATATTAHRQWFLDHFRVTPNELNRAEAMRQKEQAAQPVEDVAEGVAEMPTREQEAETAVAALRDRVTAELRQARVGPEEAQASVALWVEAARTAIAKLPDMSVAEVMRRFNRVQIVAQPVAAFPDGKAVSRFETTGETMPNGAGVQVPVLKATRQARATAARYETMAAERGPKMTEKQRTELEAARQALADAERVNATLTPVDFAALRGPVQVEGMTPEARASVNVEANADVLEQAAFHGSPYVFDQFSLSKIGTGEGAQAYGWGLYFAESPDVAEGYRKTLSRQMMDIQKIARDVVGADWDYAAVRDLAFIADNANIADYRTPEKAATALVSQNASLRPDKNKSLLQYAAEYAPLVASVRERIAAETGALYRVEIPDGAVARMLDWDKPLSEQAPDVREAIAAIDLTDDDGVAFPIDDAQESGRELYQSLVRWFEWDDRDSAPQRVSLYLNSLGIPGIKYLDAGSRGAGDGTRNLVVFDETLVTITERNGQPVTPQQRADFLAQPSQGATMDAVFAEVSGDQRTEVTPTNPWGTYTDATVFPSIAEASAALPDNVVSAIRSAIDGVMVNGEPSKLDALVSRDTAAFRAAMRPVLAAIKDQVGEMITLYRGVNPDNVAVRNKPFEYWAPTRQMAETFAGRSPRGFVAERTVKVDDLLGAYATMTPDNRRYMEFYLPPSQPADFLAQEQTPAAMPETLDVDGVMRPTRNSEGRPIHPTEEGVRNFWRWFGDSKVVDAQGRPLVVYHGTSESFDSPNDWTFATAKPEVASAYAERTERAGSGPNVMPYYMRLLGPFVINANGEKWHSVEYEGVAMTTDDIAGLVQENGMHDGVIFENINDGAGAKKFVLDTVYVSFEDVQVKSAIGNSGEFGPTASILRQGGLEPRGAFIAPAGRVDGPRLVALFKERNQSTFLHESAHAFLDLWTDLAADPNASPEFRELVSGVRAELGATEGERLSVAQEETFAGLFMDYAKSGKAPSVSLRQAFASFAAFLTKLWSFVKGEIVPANENVRDLLDRLLATDDAIAEARGEFMAPLFPEDATINAAFVKARTEAEEQTRTEAMRAVVRAEAEWWKRTEKAVAEEVREQVNRDPAYIARQILTTGRMPDGSELPAGTPLAAKLNRAQVVAILGEDATKALPRGKAGAVYNTSGEGLDLSIAAEALGYANGPELLAALQQTVPIDEQVTRVTKATMTERYGDPLTDGTVPQVAVEALHNDALDRMRQLEMEAILRDHPEAFREAMVKAASRPVNVRELKEWAAERLANRPLNTVRPAEYLSAERKAGQEAIRAVAKGEWAKAVQAKARQRASAALYAQAVAIKENVAKFQDVVAKVFGEDERIAKTRNLDIVMAARQVLASVGVGKREQDTAFYLDQLKEYDPETAAALDAVVKDFAVTPRNDFKALTVAEFENVKAAVTELWDTAKQTETIHIAGKAYKKAEVKAGLLDVLRQMPDSAVEGMGKARVATFRDKANRAYLAMAALLRRVESWVDLMDGGDINGPFRFGIFQTIRDRTAEKSVAATADLTAYRDMLEAIRPTLTTADIPAPELGRQWVFKGKAHLLGTLLHTGNPSNMAMLLGGRNWTMDGWTKFRDRMVAEGVLTPADFDFIQQVWNLFETKKPEAQKVHKRMFGLYFDEITREGFTITFPDGTARTYAGGYTPASKDPDVPASKAQQREADSLLEEAFGMRFPSVQRGFTMGRVRNFEPLLLSLDIVPKHLDAVNKFIYLAEPVREVGRLLRDKELRAELDRVNPSLVNDLLMPWLQRASTQMVQAPSASPLARKYFDPIAKYLRTTAGAGYMFLNVGNALEQATGLSVAAVRVNPKFLTQAQAAVLKDADAIQAVIDQHSPFMQERVATQLLEVSKRINNITTNPNVAQRAQDFMAEHAYVLQSTAQNYVDKVVWYGSYLESTANGMTVEEARVKADADVRLTQGSFDAVDVSRAEGGTPWVRLFTMFASYFNMLANLNATEMQKAVDSVGLKKSMPRLFAVYTLGFAVPILASNLIRRGLLGRTAFQDFDGEDEWGYLDDFLRWFFGQQLSAGAAMVPAVGQVPMAVVNAWDDKTFNDQLTLSPAFSFVESSVRGTKASYDILFGDMQRRDIRDALALFTLMSRIPLTGAARPLTYLYDVETGRTEPSGPVDFLRGLTAGR